MVNEELHRKLRVLKENPPFSLDNIAETIEAALSPKSALPLSKAEEMYLAELTRVLPGLQDAGITPQTLSSFASYSLRIATDPRSKAGNSKRLDVSRDYIGWLAHDVTDLSRNYGFNEDSLKAFIEIATRSCLTGRSEHDHLSEQERFDKYTRALGMVKKVSQKETGDLAKRIRAIFQTAVYGDVYSGIDNIRVVKGVVGEGKVTQISEEYF